MANKILSIVTVAYNNVSDVRNELSSIQKYNDIGEALEVIVVDHSSNSIIPELEKDFPNVIFVSHENLGFGAGNNFGAKYASGEYICFLNPDTLLIEPIFQAIIDEFRKNKDLGIIGTQLVNINYENNLSFYYIDKNSFISKQLIHIANHRQSFNPKTMYISGANLFVRASIFFAAGMFDEKMFMYYEEPDLTKRIRELGFLSAFLPHLRIVHLEGKHSTPSLAVIKRKYASAKYYCKKYNLDYRKILYQDYYYNKMKLIVKNMMHHSDSIEFKKKCDFIRMELENSKNA